MAYITETREHPNAPQGNTWGPVWNPSIGWVYSLLDPGGTRMSYLGSQGSSQVTYSWRTGRRSLTDEQQEALLASENQAAVFGHLKQEYDNAPQSSYDTGHEFKSTQRLVVATPTLDESWMAYGSKYRYRGPALPDYGGTGGTFITPPTFSPTYWGTEAINNCKPLNPVVSLAVGLAELKREGFPKVGMALYNSLKRGVEIQRLLGIASEEYLAWEFGFKPLLSDYLGTIKAFAYANTVNERAILESGKLLHRSYTFPVERSTTDLGTGSTYLSTISPSTVSWGAWPGTRSGSYRHYHTQSRRVWFDGAFTYYYPAGQSLIDLASRADFMLNALVGHRIGADVIWNLTPWSWLADWKFNFGSIISNAEALSRDGLVMKYGYVMAETISDHTIVLNGPTTRSGFAGPYTTIYRTIVRERHKASPFGFALDPTSFTDRQWRILSALGFTKADKVLH